MTAKHFFLALRRTGMGLFSGLVSSSGGAGCCGCIVALDVYGSMKIDLATDVRICDLVMSWL